jgi:hypothetical protein
MCVSAVGLLAVGLPKLMSYDARTDEHALRLKAQRAATATATTAGA